jgi:hypothetical protein
MIDFEQAKTLLENGFSTDVADQMSEWHPAVLGEMIRAVDAAKQRRRSSSHRDYLEPLFKAYEREFYSQPLTEEEFAQWVDGSKQEAGE